MGTPASPSTPAPAPVRETDAAGHGQASGSRRPAPRSGAEEHRRLRGVWLWPGLLALVLALYGAGDPQLWQDELNSWDMATRSTGRLLETVRHVDAVLAAYYFLLHGWTGLFGDSDLALRLPSVLAAAGAAVCTALIGERLFGRRAGLVAGLLFALTPAVMRYAQEARPYALVVFAVALATLLLLRALDRPDSRWRWAAYAAAVAAVGLLHLVALTALAGHVAAAAAKGRAAALRFACAALAGVAAASPVVLLGRAQAGRQISWIPGPDLAGLATLWPQLFGSALVTGLVMTLAALAWAAPGKRGAPAHRAGPDESADRTRVLAAATASAVAPPLILWTVSHGDVSYFHFRYLLFTLPAWAVLAGAALRGVRPRAVVAVLLAGLGLLTLPEQGTLREPYAHFWQGVDYRGAAATIRNYHRPGDAVIYDRGEDHWRLLDAGVRHYLPRELHPRDVFLARSAADRADLWASECPDPARCLRAEPRIWLVVPSGEGDPLNALPAAQARALRAHYTATGTERLTGVTVALLIRKG
ncbi:glycosyltransferase family 39 protein [Streptomyces sp. NPDC085481]|uniref:glycosyltransferase family 39 protein n=1 Tax=Streptomyces sp. NPDC085481 TaxID=3365727 RepID=UPI0037D0033A